LEVVKLTQTQRRFCGQIAASGFTDFVFSVSSSNTSPDSAILEIVTAVPWMIPIGPKHRKPVLFARSFIRKKQHQIAVVPPRFLIKPTAPTAVWAAEAPVFVIR
jgi:hypothetical protein